MFEPIPARHYSQTRFTTVSAVGSHHGPKSRRDYCGASGMTRTFCFLDLADSTCSALRDPQEATVLLPFHAATIIREMASERYFKLHGTMGTEGLTLRLGPIPPLLLLYACIASSFNRLAESMPELYGLLMQCDDATATVAPP